MNDMSWSGPRTAQLPGRGARALCPLLMAGDPDIEGTRRLLKMLVELGVPMVELCIPFANPFTDGPVLQRAHTRSLQNDCDLNAVVGLIEEFHDSIAIVVLADTAHTLMPLGFDSACVNLKFAGAAALLPHGLMPRQRQHFQNSATRNAMSVVGTVYASSKPEVRRRVFEESSAYIYVVSAFGKSGGSTPDVSGELQTFRTETDLPLAVGFGLKTGTDVRSAIRMGADIAIVGSAVAAAVEADGSVNDRDFPRTRELLLDLMEGTSL